MKFKVTGVNSFEGQWDSKPAIGRTVTLTPVSPMEKDKDHENAKFWEASPSGKLEITIMNPAAADELEVGQEFYLLITKERPPGIW